MAEDTGSLFADFQIPEIDIGEPLDGPGEGSLFPTTFVKTVDLEQLKARKQRNVDKAVTDLVGLKSDSLMGTALNTAVSLVSGGSRFAGNVITAPIDAAAAVGQAGVPEPAIAAYSRKKSGKPAEIGDAEALNAVAAGDDGIPQTNEQRLVGVEGLRQLSKKIADGLDISARVNTDNRDELSDDIRHDTEAGVAKLRKAADLYDQGKTGEALLEGGSGMFSTITNALKAGVNNPLAVTEYAAENLPQLAAAVYSGGLSTVGNVGYGLDVHRKGILDYQATHDGALPDEETRMKMGLGAASASLAEIVGDKLMVKGLVDAGAKGAKGVIKSAAATANATLKEGATEGYQQWAEGVAQNKDASLEEIVEAGAIGGLIGGTYHGAAELGKPLASGAAAAAKAGLVNAAMKAGDLAALANPSSEAYAPERAIQLLHADTLKNPDNAEANSKHIDKIQESVHSQIADLESKATIYSDENKANLTAAIAARKGELAAATDPEEQVSLTQRIQALEAIKPDYDAYTPEVAKAEAAKIEMLKGVAKSTAAASQQARVDATPDAPALEAMIQSAKSTDPKESGEAGDSILTLTMNNPGAFTPEQLMAAAEDMKSGLTPAHRKALRLYSEAQQAQIAMKGVAGVSDDITNGNDGFKGINGYNEDVRLAMNDGNVEEAKKQVNGITKFAKQHAAKAKAFADTYAKVRADQNKDAAIQIYQDPQGNWTELANPVGKRELKSMGGYEISKRSRPVTAAIVAESAALNATSEALAAVVAANPHAGVAAKKEADAKAKAAPKAPKKESRATKKAEAKKAAKEPPKKAETKPKAEAKPKAKAEAGPKLKAAGRLDASEAFSELEELEYQKKANDGLTPEQQTRFDAVTARLEALNKQSDKLDAKEKAATAKVLSAKYGGIEGITTRIDELEAKKELDDREQEELSYLKSASAVFEKQIAAKAAAKAQRDAKRKAKAIKPDRAPHPELDQNTVDALTERLKANHVIELGGRLLRDEEGKPYARTRQLESDRDIQRMLSKKNGFGYTAEQAIDYLNRALSGKGQRLTEKQTNFVEELRKLQQGKTDEQVAQAEADAALAAEEAKVNEQTKTEPVPEPAPALAENASAESEAVVHADDVQSAPQAANEEAAGVAGQVVEELPAKLAGRVFDTRAKAEGHLMGSDLTETFETTETSDGKWSFKKIAEKLYKSFAAAAGRIRGKEQDNTHEVYETPEGMFGIREISTEAKPKIKVTALNYQDINLVENLFTQSAGKDTDATKKPLVVVKDFMSAIRDKSVKITDFVKMSGPPTPSQKRAIAKFGQFQKWAEPFIRDGGFLVNPGKGTERFRFNDYAQFFIQPDGTISENVMTAVAFSMFNWANEHATKLVNGQSGVNAILGKDSDNVPSDAAYEWLNEIGIRESAMAASLGADVAAALGLRSDPNAPANEQARLEASLGMQVIGALVRSGMAERRTVTDTVMQNLMNSGVAPQKNNHTFISVVKSRDANGKLIANPQVAGVREASVGSQSIISRLFGSEKSSIEPSFEPLNFSQAKAKRTNQDVPPVLADRLDAVSKEEHHLRLGAVHVAQLLSGDLLYKIGGAVDINDSPTHVEKRASREAKNDGIKAEVDNTRAFLEVMHKEQGLEQAMYFGRSVWKPQRVGLTNNVMNPQTQKFVRSLISMPDWETDLKFDDQPMMDSYKLRVLEALGVKTENGLTPKVLEGFDKKVNHPDIVAAVNELAKILRDEHETGAIDEAAILAGIQEGKEGFHTLEGLMALATVQNAVAAGQTSVKVTLSAEVDGVTNGPMFALMLLGAKDFGTMNMGGFFGLHQPEYTQLNHYKAAGNLDLYQSSIADALHALPQGDPKLAAMQVITGTLMTEEGNITSAGRNIIKQPVTAIMFGSGTATAVADMADGFIDTIYAKMEEAAANPDRKAGQAEMKTLLTAVNTLIGTAGLGLNTDMTFIAALETPLGKARIAKLKAAFQQTLGENIEAGLKANFEIFLARRDVVNRSAELAFDVYEAAKAAVIESVMANSPALPRTGKGVALTTLSKKQLKEVEKRLKGMEPILQTVMSKESKQLSSGMNMSKTKRTLDASDQYNSDVWLGEKVDTVQPDGSIAHPKSTQVSGMRTMEVRPGAAPLIGSVHSFDSGAASGVYSRIQALNVHDALIVGLHNAAVVGQMLNEQTFKQMLEYSPAFEMVNTLERTLAGVESLLADPKIGPIMQAKLEAVAADRKKKKRGSFEQQLESMRHVATQADTAKYTMMANMSIVDQYATDKGAYEVSDENRAAAEAKLAAVGQYSNNGLEMAYNIDQWIGSTTQTPKANPSVQLKPTTVLTVQPAAGLNTLERAKVTAAPELAEAITKVQETMVQENLPLESAVTAVDPEIAADVVEAANNATVKTESVWGTLGVPLIESDTTLVNLLANTQNLTAHQLIDHLSGMVNDNFTKLLLRAMKKVTRQSVKINYVTSDTGPDGAFGKNVSKARGWYAQNATEQQVNIKSPEFAESGITVELLVHELLHAALATTIERSLNGNGSEESNQLVEDLEALRVQAAEAIKGNAELTRQFSEAVTNVHELVSWGMTNTGFQKVLKGLKQKTLRGQFTDGLKAFIDKLTRMMFGTSSNAAKQTGMGLLISHTSGLLADAAALHGNLQELSLNMANTVHQTDLMTTEEIFDALGAAENLTANHADKLRTMLQGIVKSLHGAYGSFYNEAQKGQALTSTDVYLKALKTGKLPFASKARAHTFVMSNQEGYVLEQVEATVAAGMESKHTIFARSALETLFQDAKKALKPKDFHKGDWATATPNEIAIAEGKYDFLFRPERGVTKSDYLSRFASLGLASQEISNLLKFETTDPRSQLKDLSFGRKLFELFNRLLVKLGSIHTGTVPGMRADIALHTLVERLVDIEAKNRQKANDKKLTIADQFEISANALAASAKEKVGNIGRSEFFKTSTKPLVKFAGAALTAYADDRVESILDGIMQVRDNVMKQRQGFMAGLVSEFRGITDTNRVAFTLFKAAKQNETDRKQHIEYTISQVMNSFINAGKNLSPEEKAALTRVLLRTNATALLEGRTMAELTALLESPKAQQAERERLEQALIALPQHGLYRIRAAKELAYHKVIGGSVSDNQMLSTDNIARMYGDTGFAGTVSDVQAKEATALLDQLMPLYALDYSTANDKAAMMRVLRIENARGGKDNGIEMLLKLHAGLQAQSKELLFKGSESLQITGYVPDITDSKIEALWVDRADIKEFLNKGFTEVGNVQQDVDSPVNTDLVMVVRRGSGQTGLLSGAMSNTGMHAKGSTMDSQAINAIMNNVPTSQAVLNAIAAARAPRIAAMHTTPLSYDPRKAKAGKLVPVLNDQGKIVDQRYMMAEVHRDSLLDRDSSMDQVLGVLAGQIVDKVSSRQQNADVIGTLYDQYKEDFGKRPASYIKVGIDSTDKRLQELYRLLPLAAKRDIKRIWKGDNMYIPADQLDMIMGYRKYSLTEAFSDDQANWAEQILARVTTAIFGGKAELYVGKFEDIIQELVKETKDILVVKNIVTLVGNISSNLTLLGVQGVPLKEALESHSIALKGALSYRADHKRLMQLTQALEVGYVPDGVTSIEDEIAVLKDRIARNPVKEFIEAGLMPTIVEDVEANDSQYTYKSQLARTAGKFTGWMPQLTKDIGRQLYMAHDTSLYKFLSQTTQLSDFVARYTMHQHLISRKVNPMTSAEAMKVAEDSFVNYDIPSHRGMTFMNDMGIVWFTKYFIRMQKSLVRLTKEKPARMLSMVALNHYIAGFSTIVDSSWINHIGNNPISAGPINFPAALTELPAINGLMYIGK